MNSLIQLKRRRKAIKSIQAMKVSTVRGANTKQSRGEASPEAFEAFELVDDSSGKAERFSEISGVRVEKSKFGGVHDKADFDDFERLEENADKEAGSGAREGRAGEEGGEVEFEVGRHGGSESGCSEKVIDYEK